MKALAVVILLVLVLLSIAAVLLMLAAVISRVRRRKSGQKRSPGRDRRARGMSVPCETLAEYYGGVDKTSDANVRKLFEEGLSLKQKGDFRQAMMAFGKCLNGNLTADEKTGVLLALGNCHFAAEEWDQAREYYEKARSLARESGNERARLSTLLNLGLLSALDRKWDRAIKNYHDAIDLDRELGFAKGEAIDLNTLALLYENKGDLKSALAHYNSSIEIFRKLKDIEKAELVEENIRRLKSLLEKTSA
jgi:tetratricopeptide (TPR) repeat protein